jgi:hypothetical protein
MSELKLENPPHQCTQTVKSLQGGEIKLTAVLFHDFRDKNPTVDVWGNTNGQTLYPPRDPEKNVIKKYGSVAEYQKSPDRGLFHYITIGQYLAFKLKAGKFITEQNMVT